jgi:quercetin dioxygenase-like cupin family protein
VVTDEAFDLSSTYVHLGLGARAIPLPHFEWTAEYLARYEAEHEADGPEGRLVTINHQVETWTTWERHPAGEELVVLLSGRVDLIQQVGGADHTIRMLPGQAVINPAGVWHRSVVHEPGDALFVTPGLGTEHKPVA